MSGDRWDWPAAGPIDLQLHDRPHASARTEWWYVNGHAALEDGRRVSLFAAFFRIRNGLDEAGRPRWAHSATWALSDVGAAAYHADSRVDPVAPQLGLARIRSGRGSRDPRLNRALVEMLERGRVPLPDRVFAGPVAVATERLDLDFGGLRFHRDEAGAYRLQLDDGRGAACDLTFAPQKAPVRHGDEGLVRGPDGEEMFYYFLPRCSLAGTLCVGGKSGAVASGSGWYDHEFGGAVVAVEQQHPGAGATGPEARMGAGIGAGASDALAWNWAAAQLDDGSEVTAYTLVRASTGAVQGSCAVLVAPDGSARRFPGAVLVPGRPWRSLRTFHDYPTHWSLSVPEAELQLALAARFDDQEFLTVITRGAFWEGCCAASGTLRGAPVSGSGYVERSGFLPIEDLDQFFAAVGDEVRRAVARTLPLEPTAAHALELIASKDRPQYLDGVDLAQLSASLLAPIRTLTDRGGKAWRSYAALACCDVVRGDSRRFAQWLAMPELMHVGSLIVDDVEDRSTVRRGGPACHLIYGEPLAINAGTAAYFLMQRLLAADGQLPAERRLRLYDLYFEAMRAGHAGQALDLSGLAPLMPATVDAGSGAVLESRILATHRLKTAAPAAALARMGAVAGGGSEAQIEAVGGFFEALGLAFQIVDDVLNLRGFERGLKSRAEDIRNGVITLPVAKGMGLLGAEERRWLWETLQAAPEEKSERVLAEAVELLETCGAIEACAAQARGLVEQAWLRAEPLLEDSLPKVMLRAFGWYVLERHY